MWAWGKHILSGRELLTLWGLAPVEKNEAQSKDPSGRIVMLLWMDCWTTLQVPFTSRHLPLSPNPSSLSDLSLVNHPLCSPMSYYLSQSLFH